MMQARLVTIAALALAAIWLAGAPATAQQSRLGRGYDPRRLVRHMSDVETCLACHGSFNPIVQRPDEPRHSLWIDGDLFYQTSHARLGCQACHTNIDAYGHRTADVEGQSLACTPCHTAEEGLSQDELARDRIEMETMAGLDPNMTVALRACLDCHPEEWEVYKESIHGVSVLQHKVTGSPFCTDCHGIHYILPEAHELSLTNPANVPGTCLNCHDQSDVKLRAGLTRDIGSSFEESFHGKRSELGGQQVAVCSNCHGSHDIYASEDPRSKVNQVRVAKTCGECHEGAQLNFAAAFTHKTVSPGQQLGLYILQQIYMWVIFLMIAMFLAFAALDIFQYWRHRRDHASTEQPPATTRPRVYERFNVHHRIQHFLMAFPFTMLVLTGWPMRFPELRVSKVVSAVVGGVEVVGVLHRIFGVALIVVSVYHIAYLIIMFVRGHRSRAMLPSWRDVQEGLGDVLYWLGLRRERMRFGRYNWIEKVEYYAVIWGTAVMILTGLIIWVPQVAANYMPAWAVPASVIVHGYEALLAGLAIFLWHFYWVHLHPAVYPMSSVWLSGKLSEAEMHHHHPRELEQLQSEAGQRPENKWQPADQDREGI